MYTDLNGEFILETIALLAVLKVVIAALAVAVTAYALYQAYFSDDSEPGASPNQVATPNSNNSAFANSTGYITHPSLNKSLDQPSGVQQGFAIPAVEFDEVPIHEGTQIINDTVSNGNQIDGDGGFSITTEDVINTTLDFIPVAGGINDINIGLNEGNNWQVALGVGSIAIDVVTLGSATFLKGLVKTGIKFGVKGGAIKIGRKFWTKSVRFKGTKVYQRDDIINPKLVDALNRSNVQRMKKGLAPIGPDGKSVNLHHMLQGNNSNLSEMTQSFHKKNHKAIHINPNTIKSGINRNKFNSYRKNYWKNRASDF